SKALDGLAFFGQNRSSGNVIAKARGIECVAMQVGDTLRHALSLGVVPGAITDTIAGIHRRLAIGCAGAEIGMPGSAACARGFSERLAVAVCPGQAAKIGAFTCARTGDEETHRLGRRLVLLGDGGARTQCQERNYEDRLSAAHYSSPFLSFA